MSQTPLTPEQALLDALTSPRPADSADGLSTRELVRATGFNRLKVLALLSRLQEEGRLEVDRAAKASIDGRSVPVPVYRITAGPAKKAPRG